MPKQTKTTNKKVVSSKSSGKISTPVGVLFALGIGLVLAVVGTYAYAKYKESDLKAKAAQFTPLPSFQSSGISVSACKKPVGNSAYDVTLIATKAESTLLSKHVFGQQRSDSKNPVYAVLISKKEKLSGDFAAFSHKWSREASTYEKTATPWWNGVVNARVYRNVGLNTKIAAQGGSDLGGMSHYDMDEYYVNLTNIVPPNPEDYVYKGGSPTTWANVLKTWEARTKNVRDLVNCQ